MAWDEWEEIKAEVAARHDGGMRLNSGENAPESADLKTNASGKKAAVEALVQVISPALNRVAVHADEDTNAAESEFKGWATGSGLKEAHDEWAVQVKSLKARLARDRTSLSQAKQELQFVDHDVYGSLAKIDPPKPDPHQNV
ncbi:hypothetical protein ACFVG1_32585 [Streptomyces bacillaris]|uniref:hypothetical protein n=1 Tax=Streptomyces bacillaris TaxID=68179 RepID=UPI0035D9D575